MNNIQRINLDYAYAYEAGWKAALEILAHEYPNLDEGYDENPSIVEVVAERMQGITRIIKSIP